MFVFVNLQLRKSEDTQLVKRFKRQKGCAIDK